MWWHRPIISAFGKLRQENCELEASLGYKSSFCFIKQNEKRKKEKEEEEGKA